MKNNNHKIKKKKSLTKITDTNLGYQDFKIPYENSFELKCIELEQVETKMNSALLLFKDNLSFRLSFIDNHKLQLVLRYKKMDWDSLDQVRPKDSNFVYDFIGSGINNESIIIELKPDRISFFIEGKMLLMFFVTDKNELNHRYTFFNKSELS